MISAVSIDEQEKWDKIVKSFESYDVNYLSSYAKAFQSIGDGQPILLYYEDNKGTRAMNVIVKRDISDIEFFKDKLEKDTWYDISTPYGYGGFWIEGDYQAVESAYVKYCRKEGYISEFVRFHLFSKYRSYFTGDVIKISHNVVRSLEPSIEEIAMDFKHKVRSNIKKAENAELKVELDPTGRRLEEFLAIYYHTMDRNNAKQYYYFTKEFFQTLLNLKDHILFVHVLYEDQVISTELVLYGTENCYFFLGGTDSRFYVLRPNELLKYEIIKWAKEKGLKRNILGGGYGEDDGIFRYKKSFAPTGIYDFYIGKRILDQAKYNTLTSMRWEQEVPTNTNYFPEYRA